MAVPSHEAADDLVELALHLGAEEGVALSAVLAAASDRHRPVIADPIH
jgi:hypothetical protein